MSTLFDGIWLPFASIDASFSMQGLERLAEYDYVAIFDADFKPDTDFLVSDTARAPDVHATDASVASATFMRLLLLLQTLTVPYLIDNPEVGYVQTRWVFANPDESYLTKV